MYAKVITIVIAAIAISVTPRGALAQGGDPGKETNPGGVVPFLEGTEVHFTNQGGIVFEASIVPHLVFFQNFGDSLVLRPPTAQNRLIDRIKNNRIFKNAAISGTPGVNLRMFTEKSRPVKTPSYFPHIQYQRMFLDLTPQLLALNDRRAPRRFVIKELHVAIAHYSNGQKGCPVIGQQRKDENEVPDSDGECSPIPAEGPLNTDDGSFGSNYVRVGGNIRWSNLVANGDTDAMVAAYATREVTLRGDYDYYLQVSESLKDDYGRQRARAVVQGAMAGLPPCWKRAQLSLSATFNPEPPGDMSRFAYSGTISCFPNQRGGWGFLVRYFYGQDYYNIRYRERLSRAQVGIVYSQDGFTRIFRQ